MNRLHTAQHRLLTRWLRAAGCLVMAICILLSSATPAAAQKKKKEVEAPPSKSYTVPYMIVLAMLGIGLMTVCRPSSRLEKASDKVKEEEKE